MTFEVSAIELQAPFGTMSGLAALYRLRDEFGRGAYRTLSMERDGGDLRDEDQVGNLVRNGQDTGSKRHNASWANWQRPLLSLENESRRELA